MEKIIARDMYEACFMDFLEFLDITNKEIISNDEMDEDELMDIREILERTHLNHSVNNFKTLCDNVHDMIVYYGIIAVSYRQIYDYKVIESSSFKQFKKDVVRAFLNIGYDALDNINYEEDRSNIAGAKQVFNALYPSESYFTDTNDKFIDVVYEMIINEERSIFNFFIAKDDENYVAIIVSHEYHF